MRHDVGGDDIAVERAGLVLGRPDAHQIAIDLMVLGEPVQGLAGKVLLRHLALELDRIAAVLAHGLSPRKPGPDSPILTSLTVHPQGCTPLGRPAPECVDKQKERQDAPSPTTTNGPQTAGWAVVQCAGRDRSHHSEHGQAHSLSPANAWIGSHRCKGFGRQFHRSITIHVPMRD
jgi:hypothetical protein